jgi:CRISPR-associated protein Csh1
MINTLLKYGEQLSQNLNQWSDVIDIPKIDSKKENLVIKLIFNVDEHTIGLDLSGVYQEKSPKVHRNVKTKDRNGKATYVCSELDDLLKIEKTFFGKIDNKGNAPLQGEFKERIDKVYPQLKSKDLYKTFDLIFKLRSKFYEEKWNEIETTNKNYLGDNYKKTNSKIVLIYACIMAKDLGYIEPKPLYEIDGFDTYIELDRFTKPKSDENKISYATGESIQNVIETTFPNRHSLNYMFVKETLNYASQFKESNFQKNYQVNADEQLFLERASQSLLERRRVNIANITHCVIPQFLNNQEVDYEVVFEQAFRKSELLFGETEFENSLTSIEDSNSNGGFYWVNYLAYKSDGNSFKTINLIKDVSKLHLDKAIEKFKNTDNKYKKLASIVDWEAVMTYFKGKEKKIAPFNLAAIYYLIPQRKDKENKNEALLLFKNILENRNIDKNHIFEHFTNLILCHRFGRYEAFTNVKRYSDENFDFAVRDSVFKYLAIFDTLRQLNLLNNMEQINENDAELISIDESDSISDYQQKIDDFFTVMRYEPYQKALFFLGRMLSSVAYIQKDKKKTVLDKLNFNGMSKNDIQRLRIALIEKAKQYKEIDRVIFNDARFNDYFDFNQWNTNPHESLFFILTGYSFGINTKK